MMSQRLTRWDLRVAGRGLTEELVPHGECLPSVEDAGRISQAPSTGTDVAGVAIQAAFSKGHFRIHPTCGLDVARVASTGGPHRELRECTDDGRPAGIRHPEHFIR